MGHSFGGGFTQILLDRGVGAVGVGVAPATVKGVRDLPLSTIKSAAPLLAHPFKKYGGLDEKQFHYAFANTLGQEESNRIRERYAVPGPAEVPERGCVRELHAPRGHGRELRERGSRADALNRLLRGSKAVDNASTKTP